MINMDEIGNYEIKDFPKNKQILSDIYEEFHKKHYMTGFLEIEISHILRLIQAYNADNQIKLSFTGWLAKCISEAISKHPKINAYRWKKKMVIFDDIDIIIMVEREIGGKSDPYPCVIRNVNEKSLGQITQEIRDFQTTEMRESQQLLENGLKVKLYQFIPKFIRKWIIRRQTTNPFSLKSKGGTAVITSVGMFGNTGGWITGFGGLTTMAFGIGGRTKRLEYEKGEIVEKSYLNMTVNIDHEITDGGPATRFIATLVQLMNDGFGI